MSNIQVNVINNANTYLDDQSLLGCVEENKIPDIKAKMKEIKAQGMIGTIKVPVGFEPMEGEIKWNSVYGDVAVKTANPFKAYPLQLRSNIMKVNSLGISEEVPMVTFMTVRFTENAPGSFKQHEADGQVSKYNATYLKQIVDGVEVVEIDYMANVFKVNGEDLLADYRANIGG